MLFKKNKWQSPARAIAAVALCLAIGAAHAQDIVIGQVASQTNVVTAVNAKGVYSGMKAYFDSTNAHGGINGRMLRIITQDDNLDAAKMVEMTKGYIANPEILALSGYLSTSGLTALGKQDIPGKAGIALIAPQQGDKSIVGANNFFPFRSGYPDEVAALVKEAADTQKKKVMVVYWNVAFGPAMAQLAQDLAKQAKLNVVATIKVDAQAQDKFESVMQQTVAAVVKEAPDAVLMLMSSRYVNEFIKRIKDSPAGNLQLYAMSVVVVADIVKAAGVDHARGVVIAQSVPYPFSATLPMVREYQKLLKQYAPDQPLSFSTLEGFVAGKITVEALKRAGPKPTREKILKALYDMGEFDLGGVYVNYSPKARLGWGGVDLTIIGPNGKLLR